MKLKTELCDLLGIEHPIIQGGMAWVSTAELVSAVSNAGGLGIIGAGQMPPENLELEIYRTRDLLKDKSSPFGVNVMLMHPKVDEIVEIILRLKVPVVTTGAGSPGKYIKDFKKKKIKVIPVIPSVALAKRMESAGADAVIAEGMEAGGHIGELTTFTLVPQAADVVKIPVIAAGGIADGRGIAAAFALGAKGVQMGTRFMCAKECTIHPKVKEKIIKSKDRDTTVTGYSTGHPVRVLQNRLSKELEKLDQQGMGEELERRGAGTLRMAMREGDVEWGSLMAGQCSAMVNKIEPAKDIIDGVIKEACEMMNLIRSYIG
ncbi:MAG: enoyl-[acyl-carrier-protein] reductase FabK [Actinobacteria bacterium]|nr:enoyl-[acyl-carrier-protein] reductase FabK [Actinomycetota bacterium]